ncbi:YqaJ viral recombinase family protein [Streptomyces klenkii]|uniref:YqaJ viral recombinase family nuclease n=1 Tax=Streptomyces klenkii TaxID=1420899 RepID=UPI0036EED1CC
MSHNSPSLPLTYPSGAAVVLAPDASSNEWHATRTTGLGGSDMAAICGLNPYTSPLEIWFAKVGQPVPRRDNAVLDEAALMGHALEPVVATRFIALTGLPVYDTPGTLRHPTVPWLLGNIDRAVLENGQWGGLEIKTRSSYALNEWIDEPPVDVQVQTQTYMALTGWQFYYTATLIGGQRTIVHRLERDEELIGDLLAIGEEFWGWVESRQQPPVDGSHATGQLLDRLHAHPDRKDIVADVVEVEWLLAQRARAKEQIAAGEIALLEAENRLKAIAGDATDVYAAGELAYSWRPQRGQISWKTAALAANPDLDPEPYRGQPNRVLRIHQENQ